MKSNFIIAVTAFLSACASQPNDIPTQSVSTLTYRNYDCDQISMELDRINRRAGELYASLKNTADNGAVQMGVGLILFWPTLFFLEGGDGVEAQEYARLKGERTALEIVAVRRKCAIEFKPLKPPVEKTTKSDEFGPEGWNH